MTWMDMMHRLHRHDESVKVLSWMRTNEMNRLLDNHNIDNDDDKISWTTRQIAARESLLEGDVFKAGNNHQEATVAYTRALQIVLQNFVQFEKTGACLLMEDWDCHVNEKMTVVSRNLLLAIIAKIPERFVENTNFLTFYEQVRSIQGSASYTIQALVALTTLAQNSSSKSSLIEGMVQRMEDTHRWDLSGMVYRLAASYYSTQCCTWETAVAYQHLSIHPSWNNTSTSLSSTKELSLQFEQFGLNEEKENSLGIEKVRHVRDQLPPNWILVGMSENENGELLISRQEVSTNIIQLFF